MNAFQASAFQKRPAFQIEAPQPPVIEGPRGAWISDERVEKARRRRWERRRQAQEELRAALTRLMRGEPHEARQALAEAANTIELEIIEAPEPDPRLIELRTQLGQLMAGAMKRKRIRDMIAALAAEAALELEATDADEEAAIVALLLTPGV